MIRFASGIRALIPVPALVTTLTLALGLTACAGLPQSPSAPSSLLQVHVIHAQDAALTGGQPTADELRAAAHSGLQQVINIRTAGEFNGYDEAQLAHELGLVYHHFPIAGPKDLNFDTVLAFDRLLREAGEQKLLVHCASGNRIGALFALRAAWLQGADEASALEIGRHYGLTSLEASVRALLQPARKARADQI